MERPRRPASDAPTESLDGSVERIVYASDESGWSVVRIESGDGHDAITAVGNLVGVQPGERLRLTGQWVQDRRWGRQFQVASYVSLLPATLGGIERYLGSGLVPGIGKVMARRLVQHFGLETLDILEHHPRRLQEVAGIGAERSRRLEAAWAEQRHVRDVMVFLQSHGITPRLAARIVKLYGNAAMARVREHPYLLARDVSGIGFLAADRIAESLGIARDSPERADAAVAYVVDERAGEGHVFVPRRDLEDRTLDLLGLGDRETIRAAVKRLAAAHALVVEPVPGERSDAVYGAALHAAETGVAECVEKLLLSPSSGRPIDADAAVA